MAPQDFMLLQQTHLLTKTALPSEVANVASLPAMGARCCLRIHPPRPLALPGRLLLHLVESNTRLAMLQEVRGDEAFPRCCPSSGWKEEHPTSTQVQGSNARCKARCDSALPGCTGSNSRPSIINKWEWQLRLEKAQLSRLEGKAAMRWNDPFVAEFP